MATDFRWRPSAVVLIFALGASAGWRTRSEGMEISFRDCSGALELDGEIVCGDDLALRIAQCVDSRATSIDVRAGDALSCLPDQGWSGLHRMQPAVIEALGLPVDLNRADAAELMTVRFIGAKRAATVLEKRPFADWAQFDALPGVGEKSLAAIQSRAFLGYPRRGCMAIEGPSIRSVECRRE
jgi:hypothetical protein